MKIAFYLPSLAGGGAERAVLSLALGLRDRGHSVVLVLDRPGGALDDSVPTGVQVHHLNARRTAFSWGRLAKWLRAERPDALISSLTHNNISAVAGAKFAGFEGKVVLWEHSTLSETVRRYRNFRWISPLVRALYPLANAVVAVSKGVAADLKANFGVRSQVIYNPIDLEAVSTGSRVPPPHHWLLKERTSPVIVAVGRLCEAKDYPTLLQAIQASEGLRLIILGEGEDRSSLEKLVVELDLSDRVLLPGFAANPYAWVSRADAFVLSSMYEGFSNVLVEALACEVPVVSTDCRSGPREILQDGALGELVPVGDVAALARALTRAIATPAHPNSGGRASEFSIDRAAGHFESLIEDRAD